MHANFGTHPKATTSAFAFCPTAVHLPGALSARKAATSLRPAKRRIHFVSTFTATSRNGAFPALSHARSARRVRTAPRMHTACGDCGSHSHDHAPPAPDAPPPGPIARVFNSIIDLRQSLRLAIISALCLTAASVLYLLKFSNPIVRVPLFAASALTLLPAMADSLAMLYRTRLMGLDVGVMMTVAALVCVCTGALFEGALLTTLYALSHAAEHEVTDRARRDLRAVRDLAPEHALRLTSADSAAAPTQVPVSSVKVGDFVLVRAGEVAPVDGSVAGGPAFIAVPHLTGEATPRAVSRGDAVPAGARTLDAPLVLCVSRVGAESSLARISRLVVEAQENQPRITRFFERFGRIYARLVLVTAAAIAMLLPALPGLAVPFGGHKGSVKRALGFLVATSPCALVIGAPVAYLAALSALTRRGILVKSGARGVEGAAKANAVVFDKTGTLTTGRLAFAGGAELATSGGPSDLGGARLRDVVGAGAALERGAVHPVATAMMKQAAAVSASLPEAHEVRAVPGEGVEGTLARLNGGGDLVLTQARIGRAGFAAPEGLQGAIGLAKEAAAERGETATVMALGEEHFILRFADEVRAGSRDAVARLADSGINVSVLTGDGSGAAAHVAGAVGAHCDIVSDATPSRKLEFIQEAAVKASREGRAVVMVGDGVNDAPALAAAHVGVACGLSSATAVHAADVVLVRERLDDLVWFLEKSKRTEAIVQQNVVIALVLMVAAAGSVVGGSLPLWLCVIMHEGGTILVGLNGLRLLR